MPELLNHVHGILLLDKPTGITSNKALGLAKKILQIKKAGHTGSLDPLANGMLPLCFGEATKFSRFLLEADKSYRVIAKLGVSTKTGDSEGEITRICEVPKFTTDEIESALNSFRGEIDQIPSMYSALKHQGQPLYRLARNGIEVERPSRRIHIYELILEDLTQTDQDNTLTLQVTCSKGTYIRTLVEDLGQRLGTGAHVIYLRREWVGDFKDMPMVELEALRSLGRKSLLPIEAALKAFPVVTLPEATAYYLTQGQAVRVAQQLTGGWVSLKNHLGHFLGVGEYLEDGRIAPRRLVQMGETAC